MLVYQWLNSIVTLQYSKIMSGWWLTYPSEKSWSSSVGMMTFPTEWKVIKFMNSLFNNYN